MQAMKKACYILVILLLCVCAPIKAQNTLKSFQWSDHLPYNQAFSVTHQGNIIYAVANECIFSFNKDDNSYHRLNKVNGLSDIEPAIVKNNPYNNALVVLYKNSNIDIIKNGGTTNVPDLLNKQNIGNKTINNVTFSGKLAYLACGFGIAVFDTDALQFQDTYIIGPNGTNLNVYQVAVSTTDSMIYAATSQGIYKASLNASNLASFTNWSQVKSLPNSNGVYNGIAYFGGNIIACYAGHLTPPGNTSDTIYKFDGVSWTKNLATSPGYYKKIMVSDNAKQFITINSVGFIFYDLAGNVSGVQYGYPGLANADYSTSDVIPDPTEAGKFWEANTLFGLLKCKNGNEVPLQYLINGPVSTGCAQIQIKDDKLIIAPTFLGFQQFAAFSQDGISIYSNNTWTHDTISTSNNTIFALNCVAFDYIDNTHYYTGSFGNGLIEVKNDKIAAQYTQSNSPIPNRTFFAGNTDTEVTSLYSDLNNNLWITTNDTYRFVTIKKNDGTWANLDFSGIVGGLANLYTDQILVDSLNQTWVVAWGTGIFLYKNDGTYSKPNASNSILLTNKVGQGGLPSNYPLCMAYDKSGDMWVGTDQGIYVFYNPESILTQTSGWDAQPIYIQQDGQTQLLLATDNVTSIFVDGANNKWCGTASSGLFCFSPDGQTQLFHFTTSNSPLFSNNIITINVHPKTGEVFISTDKGMQSFQNTVIEGLTSFDDVYAYPNPVKPGYTGPILIHGMVSGASVKITDAAGNLVYEITSEGGQVVWNGQNFKGQRVASGMYMALCAATDGSQKKLVKILLLN
jgi:hypothetical protein